MTKQNEFFRIIFLCKEKVVDNCLVLCCLRFSSCNPQRVTSANFPVICLKFTSWKWKVNHLHALMYNYTCTGVTVAKRFDLKARWSVKGTPAVPCNRFSRWPFHKSVFKHAVLLAANHKVCHIPHIWLNFNSLSMTVTKKTRKINLPSS